jgi:hypothetical protein
MKLKPHYKREKRLRIIFSFGQHLDKWDALPVSKLIEERRPHVYIPESSYASEKNIIKMKQTLDNLLTNYRSYTKHLKPEARLLVAEKLVGFMPEYEKEIFKTLLFHEVPIFFLERFPEEKARELVKLSESRNRLAEDAYDLFLQGKFEKAIEADRERIKLQALLNHEREKSIVAAINKVREEILQRHPNLHSEKEIRILVCLGATHTPVYTNLKRSKSENIVVERYLSKHPNLYTGSIYDRLANLKPQKFEEVIKNPNLLARDILYAVLGDRLDTIASRTDKSHMAAFFLSQKTKDSDLLALSTASSFGANEAKRRELLFTKFEELCCPIPKNAGEVDEFLEKEMKKFGEKRGKISFEPWRTTPRSRKSE